MTRLPKKYLAVRMLHKQDAPAGLIKTGRAKRKVQNEDTEEPVDESGEESGGATNAPMNVSEEDEE
ncbi:hypothetical protein BGZ83_011820, partial [Gryganskiella cystojenkinii]